MPWTPCSCGGWCYNHRKKDACTRCGKPWAASGPSPAPPTPGPADAAPGDAGRLGGFHGLAPDVKAEFADAVKHLAGKLPAYVAVALGLAEDTVEPEPPLSEHDAYKAVNLAKTGKSKAVAAKNRAKAAREKIEAQLVQARAAEAKAQQEEDAAEAILAKAVAALPQAQGAAAAAAKASSAGVVGLSLEELQAKVRQHKKDLEEAQQAMEAAEAEAKAAAPAPPRGAGDMDDPDANPVDEDEEMPQPTEEEKRKRAEAEGELQAMEAQMAEVKRRRMQADKVLQKALAAKMAADASVAAPPPTG